MLPDKQRSIELQIKNHLDDTNTFVVPSSKNAAVLKELEKDSKILQKDKLVYMLVSYAILIIISLLKGSDHTRSLIDIQS